MAVFFAAFGQSQPIQLRSAANLLAGGAVLDVGDYAIPCVADWNGDGLPDLLVGYRYADNIALFTNSGTLAQPRFSSFTNLQAGGSAIYVAGSGCGAPAPWVCDYDGDGRRDLLVGSGSDGRVLFYRNVNTDTQPLLAPGTALLLGAGSLSVGSRATPYVCDWDSDGLDDLLCGDGNGLVHFFKNVGTTQGPVYTNDVLLQAGGTTLSLGIRSAVRVADWDGDGIKDLIVSASGYAGWCRNVGSKTAPVLAAPVALQAPVPSGGLANITTGGRMRLEVVDWNHDGVLDLLIGNWDGTILLHEGYYLALQAMRRESEGWTVLRWNSADYLSYDVLCGSTPDNLRAVATSNLPSAGRVTAWTNICREEARFYRLRQIR